MMAPSTRNHGLDGIRGLAVALVILFHVAAPGFSGAFFGVDMFFVLSGFVIWGALLHREATGRPESGGRFLERRLLRIGPALLPVLAVSVAGALLIFLPDDRTDTLRAAGAALLFASNLLFAGENDYFAGHDAQPLLHTWSLSVEMQLYLLVPVLSSLCARAGADRRPWLLGGIGIAVFVAGEILWRLAPEPAYFLPVSRLWEFLAGALMATLAANGRLADRPARGIGLLGLAMLAGVLWLQKDQVWSNTSALLPVAGTLALLWACARNRAPRILTTAPAIFLGEISYSLYLWHLPVLVMADYLIPGRPGTVEIIACLLVSTGLATLSWRFLERPFLSLSTRQLRQAVGQ